MPVSWNSTFSSEVIKRRIFWKRVYSLPDYFLTNSKCVR